MAGEQIRAWQGQIPSLVLFRRTPLQWGHGQEGEEEEGWRGLVCAWGSSRGAAAVLEGPAPHGVCSARLRPGRGQLSAAALS